MCNFIRINSRFKLTAETEATSKMEQAKIQMGNMRDLWKTLKTGQFQTNDYRMRTRVNAYLQIAIFILLLTVVIIATVAATLVTIYLWNYENGEGTALRKAAKRAVLGIIWLSVVGLGIEVVLQLWAAIRLLKSTAIGIEPLKSLNLSSFWRNVTLVFIIVDVVVLIIFFKLYFWGTLFVLLRLGFLGEVHGFRKCLEGDLVSNNSAEAAAVPVVVVNKR